MFLKNYSKIINENNCIEDLEKEFETFDDLFGFFEDLYNEATDVGNLPFLTDEDIELFKKAAWMISHFDSIYQNYCYVAILLESIYNKYKKRPSFFNFYASSISLYYFSDFPEVFKKLEKKSSNKKELREKIEHHTSYNLDDLIWYSFLSLYRIVHYNQEIAETLKKLIDLLEDEHPEKEKFMRGYQVIKDLLSQSEE